MVGGPWREGKALGSNQDSLGPARCLLSEKVVKRAEC